MDSNDYMQIFSDNIENVLQPEKTKDSLLLMKKKICKTNDLIKQYTKKTKDAECLKLELETIRKENKHTISNFKSIMDKSRELELNITKIKQENNELKNNIKEYEVLGAADKQNIQQLTCKIKEMEDEHFAKILDFDLQKASFEDDIKKLEHELKVLKIPGVKKKRSNITTSVITDNNTTEPSRDVGINVSLDDIKLNNKTKLEVQDKNIMTNEFYHLKNDPYPLFCEKCTTHLFPPPIEQIYQIMSECPDLIEPLSPLSVVESGHSSENNPNEKLKHANENILDKQSQHSYKDTQDEKQKYTNMIISDKEPECSNRNVLDEESECLDRNRMVSTSKVLSLPHLITIDYNSVSDTHNLQFESRNSSTTAQNLVNLKFKEENHTKYKPTVMDLSSNSNLTTKHSLCNRNLEETIRLLKCKMKKQLQKMEKQLQKMKKKIDKKCCCHHTATNCNNVAATSATTNITSLNSDLLANICKSTIELILNNVKEISLKQEDYKNGSVKPKKLRKCNTKKVKLKRLNNPKSEFLWKVEHLHKTVSLQDVQDVVFINHENTLPVNNELLITETTTNQSDLSDKTFSVHSTEVNTVADVESIVKVKPIAEVESIEKVQSVVDSPVILHTNTDETHMNISPSADNVESVDSSYTAPEMTLSSSHSESSTNCSNNNIVNIITARSKSQNKNKSGNVLLKNLKNLKRKINSNVRSNKRLQIEMCSDNSSEFYEPIRKRRIAHTSKTLTSQPDFEKNSIHHKMGSVVESEVCVNSSANIQTPKNDMSVEIKTDCTMSEKRVVNNSVKSTSKHRFNKKSLINNLFFTTEDSFDKTNIASHVNNMEQSSSVSAALEFVDSNNVLIDSNTINNGTTSTEKTAMRTFNNSNEPVVSCNNILPNTMNNEESNEYTSSNVCCEDSKNYKVTEDVHENAIEATSNISPYVKSHHLVVPTLKSPTNKSCNYKRNMEKDAHTEVSKKRVMECQTSDTQIQENCLSVNSEENCAISKDNQNSVRHIGAQDINRKSAKEEDLHSSPLKRGHIIKNHINDNKGKESHDEVNIGTEKKEMYINNEGNRILDLEMAELIEESMEVIYVDNDHNDNDDNFNNDGEQISDIKNNDGDTNNDIKNDVKDNDVDTNNAIKNNVKDNDSDTNNDVKNDNVKNNDADMNNDIKINVKDVYDSDMDNDTNNDNVKDDDGIMNNEDDVLTPKDQLCKYIDNNVRGGVKKIMYKIKKKVHRTIECAGSFIMKQLTRLMQSNWQDCVHDDVVEKLHSTCGPRIIAKYIIEFLAQYSNTNHVVIDNSFTPPAPVMSRCEQKIIMLLIDLERLKPTVIAFVRTGIQYKLFKLNSKLMLPEFEVFTRIYVALARLQNDREAVRIMCCDAFYCLGFRAVNVLYMALTSWPEIFPHVNDCKGLLPKCIAFLILQLNDDTYTKLTSLKMLIMKHYLYTQEMRLEDITNELMTALIETPQDGLNMALILIAKRNGPIWTYENVIKTTLLPTIIFRKYPCMYSAFCLLGRLMRSFPVKSLDVNVRNISKQLSDLLASGEFSDNEQEGIASALLNLARQEFNEVTKAVIEWTPKNSLRPNTIAQIEAHIQSRTPKFWKDYVKKKLFRENAK